jgi:membrane protease YdiL (CAAX protease family)
MWVILPYLVPLGLIVAANLGVTRRGWRWLTYICLALLNTLTLFAGLLLVGGPRLLRWSGTAVSPLLQEAGIRFFGLAGIVTALLGLACLVPAVRRVLSHWLAIDPASPVHTTALVFALYLITTSLLMLSQGETLLSATAELDSLDPGTLVAGQLIFVLFALAGVGLGLRRNPRQTLARLGWQRPTLRHLGLAAVLVVAFLALDLATSWIWHWLWPANYELVARSSQSMFARFTTPLGGLLLGLSAGIGEETLFRGALQPRFRIPLTSVLFAVGHVQYSLSPAIAEILIIGLVLGWLRNKTNTTTCAIVHAAYNSLDLFLVFLFP